MKTTFETKVAGKIGSPTGIEVPPAAIAELGASKKPAVNVSICGYKYRSTVAVMGGKFMIPLSAAHRTAAGLKAGDRIAVTLELDTAPRTVEIPADLQAAIGRRASTKAAFDALAPSRRKEYVRQVLEARAPATRQRRIDKIVAEL